MTHLIQYCTTNIYIKWNKIFIWRWFSIRVKIGEGGDFMSKKRWIIAILLAVFLISWLQTPIMAEETAPYSVTGYYSNVTLYADGSAYFDEYVTYKLQEASVEVVKPLNMSNASGIEDLEVFIQNKDESIPENDTLKPLTLTDQIADGSKDVYTYSLMDEAEDIYNITIPVDGNKGEEKTFVYRYKLNDMVFLYKDTAAFFWQFILSGNLIKAENVEIELIMPSGVNADEFEGFVVGSIYAKKEILEDSTFRISAVQVKPGESLEVAMLMPPTLIPDGRKIIDNFAKDSIIADMSSWENEASTARKEDDLRFYGGWGISILSALLSLGTGLLLYLKYGRRKKLADQGEIKGLPAGYYTPAELGVLFNKGRVGVSDFFATVLHLIELKHLEIQYNEKQIGSIVLREDSQKNKLKPHEEYVIDWLIKDLGNGSSLSLEALDQLLSSYSKQYKHKVTTWESLVYQKASKWKFEEKIPKAKAFGLGASIIGILVALLSSLVLGNQLAGLVSGLFALGLAAYTVQLKKMSQFGLIHYTHWKLFKDYLRVQLTENNSKLPLSTWEQYLIYAIPLGMGKEVLEKLTNNFKQNSFEDGNLTILYEKNHLWLADKLDKLK